MKPSGLGLLFLFFLQMQVAVADPEAPYEFVETPWKEAELAMPEFPQDSNLIEFHVGPTERNRFFVDGNTLSVGLDGVVRYVLVIKASGGATNVSFEGIRCGTAQVKLYAISASDGTWSKNRNPQWQAIENKLINQYRAVLNRNFFCPSGKSIRNSGEGRNALQRGSHPDASL